MAVYRICFWIVIFGSCKGDLNLTVTSASNKPLVCILDEEDKAVIICTTPSPSSGSSFVHWEQNGAGLTSCLNTEDSCAPSSSGRYSFTSDYLRNQYFLHIANVSLAEDQGTYTCRQGDQSKSIHISVCMVPTKVTINESGAEIVNLTGTTSCVYRETDVTIKWFYVPLSAMDAETSLDLTPTQSSEVSDCKNEARKVTSSIQQTDATENKVEVYFRVKVSHPAIAEMIQNTSKNTYFITKDDGLTIGEIVGIVFGCIIGLILLLVMVYFWKQKCSIKLNSGNMKGRTVDKGSSVAPTESKSSTDEKKEIEGSTVAPNESKSSTDEKKEIEGSTIVRNESNSSTAQKKNAEGKYNLTKQTDRSMTALGIATSSRETALST